jgi:hypothetical protein
MSERLYRTANGARWFLIPTGAPLNPGNLVVVDEDGRKRAVKAGHLTRWEITRESGELLVQQRIDEAATQATQLLDGLLRALGGPSALAGLARAADPAQRDQVLAQLEAASGAASDPLLRRALDDLAQRLRAGSVGG